MEIGSTMTLELKADDGEIKESFRCKLVEREDEAFYIDYPISETSGRTGFFMEGTQFTVKFLGHDQTIYMFDSEVRGRKKLTIPVLMLSFPGEEHLIRIQRRKYVRIETAVDVAVHPLDKKKDSFTSITIDISGGGLALIAPNEHQLSPQDALSLSLVLPLLNGETKYLRSEATIVRIARGRDASNNRLSLEFHELTDHDRQIIIRFCFERQLSMRRKLNMQA
ncbi:pilus assembly protein PilZ [Pontibacillus halophilus JSM 076056 = DSM 19796]|uniref:Pilus assembly protein PilZ n=1 Tax=Pontibacillus halophilus JSM 076056 = DSM 19796 TaxID=1385510 RepID=A0A0A5I8L6_9BACI|nr:flagellar brake domain-containing protein [Pontibacillus halophilus]KGX92182.1 pilus assembly protein PilZ [Pontibacillus halophilus JSM 076056 = DSM 19796]